jgi:hypothetical protein
MKTVKELLQGKPKGLCTISPDTRVFEALKLMAGESYVLQVGKRKFARVVLKRAA